MYPENFINYYEKIKKKQEKNNVDLKKKYYICLNNFF